MKKRGDSVRRAVTMYPEDWQTVEDEARRDDTNRSAALRRIVREWKQDRVDPIAVTLEATEDPGYSKLAANIRKLIKQQAAQKEVTK